MKENIVSTSTEYISKILEQNNILLLKLEEMSKINTHYVEILEKTNSQLNFWWTPTTIFLGGLSVVLAVATGLVSYIVFAHSRENREAIKKELNRINEENNNSVIKKIEEADKKAEEIKTQIEEANKDGKTEMAKNLEENLKKIQSQNIYQPYNDLDYMKKSDFLCYSCRSGSSYPFDKTPIVSLSSSLNQRLFRFKIKKCVSCGEQIHF